MSRPTPLAAACTCADTIKNVELLTMNPPCQQAQSPDRDYTFLTFLSGLVLASRGRLGGLAHHHGEVCQLVEAFGDAVGSVAGEDRLSHVLPTTRRGWLRVRLPRLA